MKDLRIAVFGLGRSGLAIGKAALALGAFPHVYDESSPDSLSKAELLAEAQEAGVEVTLGWTGEFADVDLIVVNPAVSKVHPKLLRAVASGLQVVSEVEFGFRISKAPIVAITGTNGKSTTTVMTYLCLRACGADAVLCGNIFGSGYPEMSLTEAALHSNSDQVLVAEISSFQLEWVEEFHPVAAGITNISPDHLNRYDSFEDYAATKQRIFQGMGPQDTAVVWAEDPFVKEPPAGGPKVFKFGSPGNSAWADDQSMWILGRSIALSELPFEGAHNYLNAEMAGLLAYAALGHREASFPEEIFEGLKQFHGLAHRMERVGEKNGVRVVNNSMCTNPQAVVSSAKSVRGPVHLLIGGQNKGLDFSPLAAYLKAYPHAVYLFGQDVESLDSMLGGSNRTFATMEEAFDAATRAAVSGDTVMLAPGCASTDQFRDFRDRGNVFRAIAKEWLRA